MGPYRAAALSLLLSAPAVAQMPGWQFSPLPGEGDRAAMGCDRDSTAADFACVVVRCEDDYSTGLHLFSNRTPNALGTWKLTLDREDRTIEVIPDIAPYSGRVATETDWLLDRLKQGSYIYLRHSTDENAPFRFISLAGSFAAIHEALYWCAPRVSPTEQNAETGVETTNELGEKP
ncbi:MAG: hypothetical protein IR164_13940 [Devosia sp.]|uniref:hypothetical protein n=1 Tax=Devosia sp. TaxID=1871048 RepID=UPI001A0ED575|nr:hypothetical protein [Devosia sp.]MBF0680030.1 hypothetical protein [Devosia sp.]